MGALCGREERTVRLWGSRDDGVEEPANTLIRFIYKQRVEPSVKYEEVSKLIRQLQAIDKELHELKLCATKEGWKAVKDGCAAAA